MQVGRRLTGIDRLQHDISELPSISAFFQPIVELTSGRVVAFEALARLRKGDVFLAPAQFMVGLSDATRVDLFVEMLRQANAFVTEVRKNRPELYVSVNVETSILMRDDFAHLVCGCLGSGRVSGAIHLELLESEKIADFDKALVSLTRLKELDIGISLDDIGSAYSSLVMLKRLPVDVIKLDQSFARGLRRKPSDLKFVHGVVALARGMGKKLVVEGIETYEVQDALTVLGAQYGQGYAIAKPMPAERAAEWLLEHQEENRGSVPESLLGCYAAHLKVVEIYRMLVAEERSIDWHQDATNPHACAIGVYLDRLGRHDTPYGIAHKAFRAVVDSRPSDPDGWERAAERFGSELQAAILVGDAARSRIARQHQSLGGHRVGSAQADVSHLVKTTAETRTRESSREEPSFPVDMFLQIAESANDIIIVTTGDMDLPGPLIVYVNPAFTRLTGYSAAEAIGRSPRMLQQAATNRTTLDAIRAALLAGRDVHEKVLNFTKSGARYWLDLRIVPLCDTSGKITHFAAIERDVTMDKRRADELELVADRDALTGIPNRRALLRVIDSEITAMQERRVGKPDGRESCLAFIDLDHFKDVNDAHGHGVGDAVLLGIADRLTENLRRSDTLGRMGGEEFALWMPGVTLRDATVLVDRLRGLVADEPMETPAGPISVTCSVGVTVSKPNDNSVSLMNRADVAMYSSKRAGRNRVTALADT